MPKVKFQTLSDIVHFSQEECGLEAIEVFSKDSRVLWSYEKLAEKVAQFQMDLADAGVTPGMRVVLMSPTHLYSIAAIFAVVKLGAIIVPVDLQCDAETFTHIVQDCNATFILTISSTAERVKALMPEEKYRVLILDQLLTSKDSTNLREVKPANADDIAAIFYTSGTTGLPKGVPLSHANLLYQVNALKAEDIINPNDRILLPLPLHHIYPFSIGMLTGLALRLPILIPFDITGPQLLRTIKEGDATILVGVPRLYRALYSAIQQRLQSISPLQRCFVGCSILLNKLTCYAGGPNLGKILLTRLHEQIGPNLRLLASGGAPLDAKLASDLDLLGWQVAIGYGLTETSPLLSLKLPSDRRYDTVGTALPGTEIVIANGDEKFGLQSSQKGEILVRSPGVFKGYLNRPEINSQVFLPDGWFRTGDAGFLDGHHVHVAGRLSSLLVIESGEKIDPEILEQHYACNPLIKEIGIFQNHGKLAAVVYPNSDALKLDGGELDRVMHDAIDQQSLKLPTYKRISGYVLTNKPLARTAMAKIRRHKLVERFNEVRQTRAVFGSTSEVSEMRESDRLILTHRSAKKVWDYFCKTYKNIPISFDTSPQLDLGVDSLEWLNISLEIANLTGIEIEQEALPQILTIRDLLSYIVLANTVSDHDHQKTAVLLSRPEELLNAEQRKWLQPLTRLQQLVAAFAFSLNRQIVRLFFQLKVEGLENLPEGTPVVLTPNHASFIDPFALAAAIPNWFLKDTQWAGWTGIAFANKFTRSFSRLIRGIPIDADHALLTSLALAGSVLRRKNNLIWFPEGRRTLTGELLPFRKGIGLLLERFPVTVIPVYLKGTADALPPGSLIIRPKKITVVFGKPVTVEFLKNTGFGENTNERIVNALRQQVADLEPRKSAPSITVSAQNCSKQNVSVPPLHLRAEVGSKDH